MYSHTCDFEEGALARRKDGPGEEEERHLGAQLRQQVVVHEADSDGAEQERLAQREPHERRDRRRREQSRRVQREREHSEQSSEDEVVVQAYTLQYSTHAQTQTQAQYIWCSNR